MGYYQPEEPLGGQKYIATNNKGMVNLFLEYYQDLWQSGTLLKEGTHIDEKALLSVHSVILNGEAQSGVEMSKAVPQDPKTRD